MNILFLDVDGVLNNEGWMRKRPRPNNDNLQWYLSHLDPENIINLQLIFKSVIIDKLVWSSTWRKNHTPSQLLRLITIQGFKCSYDFQMGETPVLDGQIRGAEIEKYLESIRIHNPLFNFVIIDDDTDMAPWGNRLVQTSCREGLTKEKADQVIKKFHESNFN